MPMKPGHPCNYSGCKEITNQQYCPHHKRIIDTAYNKNRGTTTERGYGITHQRWRLMILARDPICKSCNERPSTEADHINGNQFDVRMENGQGLCKACHSRKTVEDQNRWG